MAPPAENGEIPVARPPIVVLVYRSTGLMPVALARVATTGNRAGATTPTKLPPNMFKTAARKHRTTGMSSLGVSNPPSKQRDRARLDSYRDEQPIPPIMMRVDHGNV
ncbi:hypothetical protein JCM18916A_00940 [Cutibacterium acnes subsp. acnes]